MVSTKQAKVQQGSEASKPTTGHPVSVRFSDPRLAKLCRVAAAELDTTRSAFLAEAGVEKARAVLRLQREDDFQAWLNAA